jgi:type IV secretory pathway TrbL component
MYSGIRMRIGKLFALSMLTVTVLAVILGAEVLIPQTRIFTNRSDAIKTVDAFGATLMVSQQVAGLRAPYISPIFQENPATQVQIAAAAKAAKAADAAFEGARRAIMMLDDAGRSKTWTVPRGGSRMSTRRQIARWAFP